MAIEEKKATENNATQELGYTFGGHPIDISEISETPETSFSGVSLVDDKPNEGMASLIGSNEPVKLTDEELSRKVDRYSFALHKDFSKEDVQHHLSTGNEDSLRQLAASAKDIRDEKDRKETLTDILSQGLPEDPEQQSILYKQVKDLHGYKPSNNPMTAVEEAYAHRFIESVPFVGPKDSAIMRLTNDATSKALDAESQKRIETARDDLLTTEEMGKRIKLYQENAKDVLEKAEQRYSSESLFGKIVDFGKSTIPFYDHYNMVMDVPGMDLHGLPGTTVAEWVTKLYDQPPAVQKQWLNEAVETIGAYNPQLAVKVAEAAVSYSTVDRFLDNAFGLLDVTDTGAAVGGAVKLAGKAFEKREAVHAFKAAIRADADPRTDPVDFKAAMGDINGAAVDSALSASRDPQSPRTLSSSTPTFMNPMSSVGASEGLAGAQASRFSDFVRERADKLRKKVEEISRVNRLPEEALQAAKVGLRAEFENIINQSLNNAIQNARKVPAKTVDESKLMGQIEAKFGKIDWEPDGRELPSGRSAIAEPNKTLEDKLSAQIEAKTGKPIPGPRDAFDTGETLRMKVEGDFKRPEQTAENLARWEFLITKPDGSTFSSEYGFADMHKWARMMGLDVGDYGAQQVGNGWAMVVKRPVDETKPYVRDALVKTKNTTTPMDSLLAGLKHGGGRVSEFASNNRIAYVAGQEKMREIIEPLANDLLRLKRGHVDDLNRVMMEEMNRVNPSDDMPGYFFQNHDEFEEAYRRLNGRSPTNKETNAYIAARTLNDLEYGLRNSSSYKELARLGIKKIELNVKLPGKDPNVPIFLKATFEGKVINSLPTEASDRALVAFYDEGAEPVFSSLAHMTSEERRAFLEEKQKDGYKIIQTANPSRKPGKEVFGEDESVNFIITKDYKERELGMGTIPYREGWHQIYPYKFYVKQPVVRKVEKDGLTHHLYEGEVTHMGVHSMAESKKYAEAMETARQIAFEGRSGNLAEHLARTLPYDKDKFHSLFSGKEPTFSKTEPFHALGDGQISMDTYKTAMEGRYSNLYDTIRSPWNLMNQVDKKFVGHRDEVFHTVKEGKGSQNNPVFNLTKAERLDPLSAMSSGISNMIRNQHMIDLRIGFGEAWLKEFKHLLQGDERVLYNNLVDTIMNPRWVTNLENNQVLRGDFERAKHARNALLELLNLETPLQSKMESLRTRVIDQVYERLGQESSNEWATSKLMTTRHPLAFLRGVVYYAKIGMLSPMVALQNAAQMANVVTLSPKHGSAAFAFGWLGHLTRLNPSDPIVGALGEIAAKATGHKKEWFKEAAEAMHRSGFGIVGGSHALGDYLNDPKFIKTKMGQFLDGTDILFKASEHLLRSTAFMTAYLEKKSANPSKALTSIDLNEVLARANLYAGRMTRDEKARWQSGEMMSTFTQFWSYPARLMEMIWEKGHGRKDALTGAERLRLIAMNATLYGIPIGGVGSAVGGLVNPYDHIQKALTERGIDIDSTKLSVLFNGVVGEMSKSAFDVNVSPALGPSGRDLTQALERDHGWLRFALGPTGGLLLDTYLSSEPLMRSAWMAVNGEVHPKAIANDLLDIARNVSSIDKTTKMYLALQYNKVFTKMGQEIDEVGAWPGIVSAITGQMPSEIDHHMWEKKVLTDLPKIKADLVRQAQHDYRLSLEANKNNDYDLEAHYLKRMNILLGGLSLSERQEVIRRGLEGNAKLVDTIKAKWEAHNPHVSDEFKKAFGRYFNIPNGN